MTIRLGHLAVLLSLGFAIGCATHEVSSSGLTLMTESAYNSVVDKYTDSTEKYSGLYNTITMRGTLLNSAVSLAQLDQNARLYMWDASKFNEEKKKTEENLKKETTVFISFYTPERKHDDLHKSKTLWKIFLDSAGRRYEGKATKIKLLPAEVRSLYSYHNRFTTPYMVTFAVPVALIENNPSKFTVTGPVGSASINFQAISNP